MIEPIIMLTDYPLLAPHRQVRRCHRSIHCWHGHAARRSALPRERFSPMTQLRHAAANIIIVWAADGAQALPTDQHGNPGSNELRHKL